MRWLAGLAVLLLAGVAQAQDDVTLTPSGGVYSVKAQAQAADADTFPTASIEIVREDGVALAPRPCVAASPGQVVTLPVTVPMSDLPVVVRGLAHSLPDCGSIVFGPESNAADLTLHLPTAPVLQ